MARALTWKTLRWVAVAVAVLACAAELKLLQPALADWIWLEVFWSSSLSWLSALPVWTGLYLMRKHNRFGWLAYGFAAVMLVAVGILLHQWGFCAIGSVNVYLAFKGWRSWATPDPRLAALRAEIDGLNDELTWLRSENRRLQAGNGCPVLELLDVETA